MIKRWFRLPLAMLIRMVVTRPHLKLRVQCMLARSPLLAGLANRLTRQSSYQPPRKRDKLQRPGHMTPRSLRIYHALKKAQAGHGR
jgi:hypothetical protein